MGDGRGAVENERFDTSVALGCAWVEQTSCRKTSLRQQGISEMHWALGEVSEILLGRGVDGMG